MGFLFDTCAISELRSSKPNRNAIHTLLQLPREEIFLSVVTIGEIKKGVECVAGVVRKAQYEQWLQEGVLEPFGERVIPLDTAVALEWGKLVATLEARGQRMQVEDSFIAATALVHGLTVVTRNEADFAPSGVNILNPWK